MFEGGGDPNNDEEQITSDKKFKEDGTININIKSIREFEGLGKEVFSKFERIKTNWLVTLIDPILTSMFCGWSPLHLYKRYKD